MKKMTFLTTLAACSVVLPTALGQAPPLVPMLPHSSMGGDYNVPLTPKQQAASEQAGQLSLDAATDLHAQNYIRAEAEARAALAINDDGRAEEVLAAALEKQGKDQEALRQYQTAVEHYDNQPRNLLPYAQLLLKSGQWAQAVSVYNEALPHLPDVGLHLETPIVHDGDLIRANNHFSPDVPKLGALATALHITRGMIYATSPGWAGTGQDTEAMTEYAKALQTAPGNAMANYYYGVGWHKLSPAERVKFGTAQQAKAALQRAAQSDDPSIKKMAAETLKKSN